MKNFQILFMALTLQAGLGTTVCFADSSTATKVETTESARGQASVKTETSEEEILAPKNFGHSSTLVSSSQCKINCTLPHAACSESAQVLDIVQDYYKSLSEHNFDAISKHIDENCTKLDQASGRLLVGRQAILDDLKVQLEKVGPDSKTPLRAFTIDRPYAHVAGDNAVVTFTAIKEIGGDHPQKFESRCTDVFKREGKSWMKISVRSNWKEVNL